MPFPRARVPRRPVTSYEHSVRAVLGSPGTRPTDSLALNWAHQIAWAAHGRSLDELEQLAATAERYGVPLDDVLREREKQLLAAGLIPAHRRALPTVPAAPSRLRIVVRG
jgi:hypothetical protein